MCIRDRCKKARFIVLVPCCQAEVAAALRRNKNDSFSKTPLSELWRHPIHTREFGSQITNVLRCLQLEACGYQIQVTELVGWEHSIKNELIIARKTGQVRKNAADHAVSYTHLDVYKRQVCMDTLLPEGLISITLQSVFPFLACCCMRLSVF